MSQKEFAVLMELSRSTISQIENGKRKLSAEEIAKLSRIFRTSADVILNLTEESEITTAEEPEAGKRKLPMRISVPQKKLKKFREVILYILENVGSKTNI